MIPDYVKTEYRAKMDNHLEQMRDRTQAAGMGYHLLTTDKPLDRALTEYLTLRQSLARAHVRAGRRVMGFLAPWFLAGLLAVGLPVYVHLLRKQTTVPRPVSSLMFFEQGTQSSVRHRRLRYLLLFALRTAAGAAAGAGVCAAVLPAQVGAGERQAAAGRGRRFVQHERESAGRRRHKAG